MISPRWRKVLSDLTSNKVRTLLVVISIGIGVFAVGLISGVYILLLNDMEVVYQASNPSVATIYTMPFDDELLKVVRQTPGVAGAEGRSSASVTLTAPNQEEITLNVTSIPRFDQIKINKIRNETPIIDPKLDMDEILLERSIYEVFPVQVGDTIDIQLPWGKVRKLKVVGIVHDVSNFPYFLSHQLSGYTSPETVERLGGSKEYTQLLLTVTEKPRDESHVKMIADQVADKLKKGGREVFYTFVYHPGEHPANFIVQALLAVLGGMGFLAVFLSAFLVINTIMALLSQQIRQIGVMKAIGANSNQIIVMYMMMVLFFGLLSLAISIPLSGYLAYIGATYFARMLNFELLGFRIPPLSIILQVVVALGIPLGAALLPVIRGARITVREAISSYGLSGNNKVPQRVRERVSFIAALINRLFSRPLLLSLRNTFRRRARLALTLSTLSLGGAIFISVFNIQLSLTKEIDKTLGYFLSDVNVSLNASYRLQKIVPLLKSIPEIVEVEGWSMGTASIPSPDKISSTQVLVLAPPANSKLIKASLTSGRWLTPEDESAIVIGNHLQRKRPDLKVGDEVTLDIEGKESRWKIVGTFVMVGNVEPPFVYANMEPLAKIRNEINKTSEYRVITNPRDAETQKHVAEAIDRLMEEEGIQVYSITTGAENIAQQSESIVVLVISLLAMAILIAVVGGLGLMGTMSMNVLERTREIGVMRAIGASDRSILQLVLVEGLLIGIISWMLAIVLSVPISIILGNVVGLSMLTTPLKLAISVNGFMYWLGGVLILAALASFLPAHNASRLTIREVLAYE